MATAPNYSATPRIGQAVVSVANTARDGTGTLVTVLTAGSQGSRIDRIIVKANGTVAAGCVTIFASNGTDSRIIDEVVHGAVTASTTVGSFRAEVQSVPLVLPTGWSIRAATTIAQSYTVTVVGGDF